MSTVFNNSRFSFLKKTLLILLILFTSAISQLAPCEAAETTLKYGDIEIQLNSTWTGCYSCGYWPVRIRTINRGPKCTVRYTVSTDNNNSSKLNVYTSFVINQGATLDETLLIPMVSNNNFYMQFFTSVNGSNIKELSSPLSFDFDEQVPATPSLLLVSRDSAANIKDLEEVSMQIQTAKLAGSSSSPYYSHTVSKANVAYIPGYSQNLPSTWLGYSGIDGVICDVDSFVALDTQRQDALVSWVQSGGNLVIYQKDISDDITITLASKFTGDKTELKSPLWNKFRPSTSQAFRIERDPATGNVTTATARSRDFTWPLKDKDLLQQKVMLGTLTFSPFELSKGSASDWSWLLQDPQLNFTRLLDRTAVNSRAYNSSFSNFSIPGIQSVPVTSFLILITAFTIVIGPLNYIYFQRKKQLAMLLVSIPVLAFTTSIILILYATIAHGFSIKGSIRSVTYVDQHTNKSVTSARSALYAGQAPSRLKFSPETAVYPVWPSQNHFERGTVDWSNSEQLLQGGWIRSRTRTQFFTQQVKTERGRLNVESPLAGKLPISNGFDFDLEELVVFDGNGEMYYGSNIKAGTSAELIPFTDSNQRNSLADKLIAKMEYSDPIPDMSYNNYGRYGYDNTVTFNQAFNSSDTEKIRVELAVKLRNYDPAKPSSDSSPAKTYFATMKKNPSLDIGVSNVTERESSHLLLGKY